MVILPSLPSGSKVAARRKEGAMVNPTPASLRKPDRVTMITLLLFYRSDHPSKKRRVEGNSLPFFSREKVRWLALHEHHKGRNKNSSRGGGGDGPLTSLHSSLWV